MDEAALIDLIVEKAIRYMIADAANPDVGWGMGYDEAIKLAEHDILVEAARWNSVAALQLTFTPHMEKSATAKLRDEREKRR